MVLDLGYLQPGLVSFTTLPPKAKIEMVRPLTPEAKKRNEVELYRIKKEKDKKERLAKNVKPCGKSDIFVDAQRYL